MKRTPHRTRTLRRLPELAPGPEPEARLEPAAQLIERPDGFYVIYPDRELGPFATLQEARVERRTRDAAEPEASEFTAEAEAELALADWIDAETLSSEEEHMLRVEES